jgi:hypothetical protein
VTRLIPLASLAGFLLFLTANPQIARCEDAASPGKLSEEAPTLQCLGVRWLIAGDDNHNARVTVEYRPVGGQVWRQGPDLFRVETPAVVPAGSVPEGQTLYAGSIFGLKEGSEYEVRLALHDPDGGQTERTLRMQTLVEPRLPTGGKTVDVTPDSFREAIRRAQPGDVLRLHKGRYLGSFELKSGEPGRPIALVAAGDGEAMFDGTLQKACINSPGLHDAILEGLTFGGAEYGIAINGAVRVTIRRSRIGDVEYGIVATRNSPLQREIFITDNTILGSSTWPRTQGIENRRGVQISGVGNVVCYNRIAGFADAIDTFSTPPCSAIDIYRNEISECTDDGIEMDYSQHNTRCFENRLTNVFQGISVQPVHGGPVYIFRNAMYNVSLEVFKVHNSPSGAIFWHNTAVKAGIPVTIMTSEKATNCVSRNNLFVGTEANYAFENSAPMQRCDYDYDGFAGQWKLFLKWNGRRYESIEAAAKDAPVYRHAIRVNPEGLFASRLVAPSDAKVRRDPMKNDLRLAPQASAVDAGAILQGVNDTFRGKAPDLGAYELGEPLPHYGPRPLAPRPEK